MVGDSCRLHPGTMINNPIIAVSESTPCHFPFLLPLEYSPVFDCARGVNKLICRRGVTHTVALTSPHLHFVNRRSIHVYFTSESHLGRAAATILTNPCIHSRICFATSAGLSSSSESPAHPCAHAACMAFNALFRAHEA